MSLSVALTLGLNANKLIPSPLYADNLPQVVAETVSHGEHDNRGFKIAVELVELKPAAAGQV